MKMAKSHQRPGKAASAAPQTQSHYTAVDQWLQWCDYNDVAPVTLVLYEWVRTNAPHKNYSNTSLGVKLKDDCIHVKDWTTGESLTFFDRNPPTVRQRRKQQAEKFLIREEQEEWQQAAHQRVALQAEQLWHEAIEVPPFGYFASKGSTTTHGARWHEKLNCWLVLVTDTDGVIYTVQRIYNQPPPNKFYLKGGRSAGGMAIIGSLITADTIIVCEGFATGCTLHEMCGKTVVCSLGSGNLLPVCEALRAKYPSTYILVYGDDDRFSEPNVGRIKAMEAAVTVGGEFLFPAFHDACTSCKDFNDVVMCVLCRGAS